MNEQIKTLQELGVHDLTTRAQSAAPGKAYLAYPGHRYDGRDFIEQAALAGANAIVVDSQDLSAAQVQACETLSIPVLQVKQLRYRLSQFANIFYDHPSAHLNVMAVTGTNGKSSIVHGLNQLYGMAGIASAMIGTLGMGPLNALLPNPLTTPDPVELQRALATYRKAGVQMVAMEASSHALDQGRLSEVRIKTAIFTQLTQDHLDYHHTMQAYGAAKAKLYQFESVQSVIFNLDDAWSVAQIEKVDPQKTIWGYTQENKTHPNCHVILSACSKEGHIWITEGEQRYPFSTGLLGRFNLSNLLAMIAAMRADGFPLAQVLAWAAQVQPIPGRMQRLRVPHRPEVIVDYAHTPDALLKALTTAKERQHRKLICVFGCGGDRDATKRAPMGNIARENADWVVVTTDNPRHENPEKIIAEVVAEFPDLDHVSIEVDREKAIQLAITMAEEHDIILLAGKGHEKTQVVGDQSLPFDDVSVALHYLNRESK